MGIKDLIKDTLIRQQNKKYKKELALHQVTFNEWVQNYETEYMAAKGISASGTTGTKEEDFVLFYSHEGRLAENAREVISQYFSENPQVKMIYGDEDLILGNDRQMPWFKPEWSPELLSSSFYFGSLVAVKKEYVEGVIDSENYTYNEELWNELYNISVKIGGFEIGARCIGHIPYILFHGSDEENYQRFQRLYLNSASANETEFDSEKSSVSIVIPSKDNPELLKQCFGGIREALRGLDYEIILVDNGSSDENRRLIEKLPDEIEINVKYIYEPMEFNFSRMCNIGAASSEKNHVLFLNDDVLLVASSDIYRMTMLSQMEHTGAIGMKLYYPDSVKIQHAGITNLPMGPVHKLQFMQDNKNYYFGYNHGDRNMLAVTAACMMIRRDKFMKIKGFSEELRVAFNDVDICFGFHEAGYFNVCMNDAFAYHYESLTRGSDETPEKLVRLLDEREKLYIKHEKLKGIDPYYPENLNRDGLDTRIVPAYENAVNEVQILNQDLTNYEILKYRHDECVLFRIESIIDNVIQGYAVVLGDDNSCYDRILFFVEKDPPPGGDGTCPGIELKGWYRPDLVENMPDQKNVGMCGFKLQLDRFPKGTYRLAVGVKNNVTGLKLLNYSNRYIQM